jgi:mRNA interferase RelE/StbE
VSNLFYIKPKKSILKVLRKLPPKVKIKVKDLFYTLKRQPIPYKKYDVKKLIGYENTFRIRIGKLRILYFID